jgi:hypothetical protein
MKRTLYLLLILVGATPILGQSYNDALDDKSINDFMIGVLTSKVPYESRFNKLPKRIFYKPIHIGEAGWNFLKKEDARKLPFDKIFYQLLSKEKFSEEDLAFLRAQYNTIKDTTWNFTHRSIIFKKKHRINYFEYSIPLFNKQRNIAVMWRYTYCGSLCMYSELHTYELFDGKWVIKEFIAGNMA